VTDSDRADDDDRVAGHPAGDLGMVRRPTPSTPTRAPDGAVMP
jgi:hypothetical protein